MREFAMPQEQSWMAQRAAECVLTQALAPAFAWISPFHTDEQSFLTRLGYWGGMIGCWLLTMAIVARLCASADLLCRAPSPVRAVAMVGMAALPMILVVSPATHALTGFEATLSEVTELYFQIAILGGGISLIARGVLGARWSTDVAGPAAARAPMPADAADDAAPEAEMAPAALPAPEPVGACRLAGRLPPHVRGPIIAVQMEDHYARVHTDRGSALLLLRLSDAIAETAPIPGRQVHRSWWVAEAAIADYARTGRTGQVQLSNGVTAPVSQRYLKELDALLERRADGEGSPEPDSSS